MVAGLSPYGRENVVRAHALSPIAAMAVRTRASVRLRLRMEISVFIRSVKFAISVEVKRDYHV